MQLENEFPLVSIVSPCYNHSEYIIESLNSIREQTYQNIQHIIIDDCSTDNSVEKITEWIKLYNYKCIFIRHEMNKGISFTLNESISLSNGEYWSPLATDDVATPNRTEEFIEFLKKNPNHSMVCSDCLLIDKDSNPIVKNGSSSFLKFHSGFRNSPILPKEIGTFKSLLKGNYIPGSILIKKSAFNSVGLFDTNLIMEDWDMWLRISNLYPIGYIDLPLTKYRFHDSNTAGSAKFLERYRNEVLFSLFKAKSLSGDTKIQKTINNNIAAHVLSFLSIKQLLTKKESFKQQKILFLYYKILLLFFPNKLKLAFYNWYANLSNENRIKKIYKYFKYGRRKEIPGI